MVKIFSENILERENLIPLQFNGVRLKFDIAYTEEAISYINSLPKKVQAKVKYNLTKSRYFFDSELFKKLHGTEIWEFRTLFEGNYYRLLAFWDADRDTFVIVTHGFLKKTGKTPAKEIEKAERIRQEYFKDKEKRL